MQMKPLFALTSISGCLIAATAFAQPSQGGSEPRKCYPPEYTASGELLLPKKFHEWIYVGSPLTPNALTAVKQAFPNIRMST